MLKKGLGRQIGKARKSKGITSEKLAELCYVNPTHIRQIECGMKLPSFVLFIDICNALEVSPTYLLADVLEKNEIPYFNTYVELCQKATPKQLKIMLAMQSAALKELQQNDAE